MIKGIKMRLRTAGLISTFFILAASCFLLPACNESDRPIGPGAQFAPTPLPCGVFGDTKIEASSAVNSGYVWANKYFFSGGWITSLGLYTSGSGQFRMALYADNGSGAPTTLIAQSAAVSTVTSPGWNTAPLSVKLTPGNYWVAFQTDTIISTYYTFNSTSLPNIVQVFGPFPANYSGYSACACSVISMNANYCP